MKSLFALPFSAGALIASALLLGLSACGGQDTAASCSVEELPNGQAQVTCPDGTSAVITGPTDGATQCTFSEEGDTIHIHCDDGTDLVIRDGVDGTSGSSCAVESLPGGAARIVCDDGSEAPIGTPPPGAISGELGLELLAGVTSVGTSDGVGTETRMDGALDGAYDPSGEFLYFADSFNMTIRRFGLRTGRVVTLAGQAGQKGASDGVGSLATFEGPRGIAMHPSGDRVFIADGFNCTIRQLELATNEVTTLTGQPGECAAADGSFDQARFRLTIGMVMESSGRYLYVADRGNNVIRRLDLRDEVVETIAGLLPLGSPNDVRGHQDGIGNEARFAGPGGIDLSEDETILYVNDTFNNVIRAVVLAHDSDAPASQPDLYTVSTVAGSPGQGGSLDGVGSAARFQTSQGLARAADGLFVAGFHNSIRRIDLDTFEVTTVAGQNGHGGSADGPSFDARFGVSFGILAHPDGRRLYYMDRGNNSIRLFDRHTNQVSTVMGAPEPTGWRDGVTGESRFNAPRGVAANADGTRFYIADRANQAIRVFDVGTTQLATLAGLPGRSGFVDGIADEARFFNPEGVWVDAAEQFLYVVDNGNDAIRRVEIATGQVTTAVGRPLGAGEEAQDGDLEEATFDWPFAIVGFEGGQDLILYVSEAGGDRIRQVTLGDNGAVTTLAGGGAVNEDDLLDIDGVATEARFNTPTGLALTGDGATLFVADQGHQVIRRIDVASGTVETLVGDIGVSDAFDGIGDDATFSNPSHLALAQGDQVLLVSDRSNFAIRHVHIEERAVTTLIGALGTSGGSGHIFTPLDEARLYFTSGLAVVGQDVVFTADQALLRVANILEEL